MSTRANDNLTLKSPVGLGTYGTTYEHPMYRYITNLIPHRLRSLFRLCEQVFIGPHASAGIKKIAEYPIVDPEIFSDNEKDRKTIEDHLRDHYQIKREMTKVMYNMFVYGNAFASFHRPFDRYVKCGHTDCNAEVNIKTLADFRYNYKDVKVSYTCPICNRSTTGDMHDRKCNDVHRTAIVHWDPKRMDINPCVITKEFEYYYQPTPSETSQVREGNRHLVSCLPMGILKTVSIDGKYKFKQGELFHLKVDSPSGLENNSGWGIPPLLSAIETFLYINVLKKANESTSMERIDSMRIVYPASVTPNGDPSYMISMQGFMDRVQEDFEFWRRQDRNSVMFSPIPVGVANVGGDARPMLTHQEIQAAEDNILAILGVPREFVYGGVSYGPGSGAVLRQLENQLRAHISQTSGFLQWVCDKICDFIGVEKVRAVLGKFSVQDDMMNKQAAMSLYQSKELSSESFMKIHGYNRGEEQDRIMEEELDKAKRQNELQKKFQELEQDIATQAQLKAQSNQGLAYDINSIMAKANEIVQGMMQDPMSAQSMLANLQNTDPVMWACVSKLWETQGGRQGAQQG